MKHTKIATGRSNQARPTNVWLYLLRSLIRMKYSKSGIMLPIISPVADSLSPARINGKTIAGCEKVNGIIGLQIYYCLIKFYTEILINIISFLKNYSPALALISNIRSIGFFAVILNSSSIAISGVSYFIQR